MFKLNIGERTKGILLVLLAGASWGIISLFVRHLGAAGIDAKSIAALRSLMATLMLLAIMPFVSLENVSMTFATAPASPLPRTTAVSP